MALRSSSFLAPAPGANLRPSERLMSLIAGAGLTLLATRRGGIFGRMAASTGGLGLLARGLTGYCGMKAAATGQTSLGQGMREEWQRLRTGFGRGAGAIGSLEEMYVAELQELYSAESQLCDLIGSLSDGFAHPELRSRLQAYASELRARREDLARLLASCGADPRQHPDQAMSALVNETHKMAQIPVPNVRDAALVASLQRIIHYKIAGYGSVAAYAKALGRVDEAARLAEYADRDKAVDAELSELAKSTLNPEARIDPQGRPAVESRPH